MSERDEQRPMIPCGHALAAMGVPARRWTTRTDLLRQLERARDYLDRAALDEASVTAAADVAGLSLHHFLRLFKELHRCTPHRYLTQRRIAHAQELLAKSGLSVGAIAIEVGFTSQSAFSRLFKTHVGLPPLLYRLRQQDAQ